jgi:ketosteroid isomerase-like protein
MSLEARLAALEHQYTLLQKQHALLQARHDIWHVMTRYARGLDEQRQEDLEAIFTDDVEFVTFPWSQHAAIGKDVALEALRNYRRTFHHPRRFITNEQIQVNDDGTATGYATTFVMQAHAGQSYCGWGYYEWEFRYVDARWKIRKMTTVIDCMTTLERGWGMMDERVLPLPPRPMD